MRKPFSVALTGSFYTCILYDCKGQEVFELEKAREVAESQYGADWQEVFNGDIGMDRDDS